MTREDAEVFMFGLKNYQWKQHPLLYEHVELGIKMIYDDFESRTCENCKYAYAITHNGTDKIFGYTCSKEESDMYGEEVYASIVCNKWESK